MHGGGLAVGSLKWELVESRGDRGAGQLGMATNGALVEVPLAYS